MSGALSALPLTLFLSFSSCGGGHPPPPVAVVDARADSDSDTIPDVRDHCPHDAEDLDQYADEDGCPDFDNDSDGIADVDDLCPNEWEDCDGFQDEDGCPDPDNDGDRIPDACDSCPNDPEQYNGWEDGDGCPDRGYIIVSESQIVIIERIFFRKNEAVVQPVSMPIIDAIAATLQGNPMITRVAIVGNAEESERAPHRIAQRRAEAVRDLLVQRGVDPARVLAYEVGNTRPLDPRHTPDAREQNRRVDFRILETDQGPVATWNGTDIVDLNPPPTSLAHGPPNIVDPSPNIQPACAGGRVPPIPRPPPGGCHATPPTPPALSPPPPLPPLIDGGIAAPTRPMGDRIAVPTH